VRITSLVLLAGALAGALVWQSTETPPASDDGPPALLAGVALPAARTEPTLSSTWFCAGGTGRDGGSADHEVLIANPTDRARTATVTVLTGEVSRAPSPEDVAAGEPSTTSTTASATTTTAAPTTTGPKPSPRERQVAVPAQSRVELRLADISQAQLVGAVIEVDGGRIAVEHSVTGPLGRATAPCSTTASPTWSFPWGVTARGARELLVFMNPFPDDATVDIDFATDEGVRDTARFQGFVVPGRSVVGAFIDQDVTRKAQVSAHARVRGGRLIIDRIQMFDGTDAREGITLGLGVPTPAEVWMFPTGETGPGLTEQVVVFNPSDDVAEVEVEARLDDPTTNGTPEPFALTVAPGRYSIIDVHNEDRVPTGVGHALIVRSLNGVPVTAERVNAGSDPAPRRGITATTGSPFGAPIWYFAGGGPTGARDEYLVLLNTSIDTPVTFSVTGFSSGQTIAVQNQQSQTLVPGGRAVIRLGDSLDRADLPVMITADGPIVAERGLYRIGGQGISQAMGIPLAEGLFVPDPVDS
jgi:hypothetical protein